MRDAGKVNQRPLALFLFPGFQGSSLLHARAPGSVQLQKYLLSSCCGAGTVLVPLLGSVMGRGQPGEREETPRAAKSFSRKRSKGFGAPALQRLQEG